MRASTLLLYSLALVGLLTLPSCKTNDPDDQAQAAPPSGAIRPVPTDSRFNNPWTPEMEQAIQERGRRMVSAWKARKPDGSKAPDGKGKDATNAMMGYISGQSHTALPALQAEDAAKTDHAHTEGINYFNAETLPAQIRKYFLFGSLLDPAYKKRMFEGAKKWTATDPIKTPHPLYGTGKPEVSGQPGPKIQGYQADRRNTDHFRAMRDTSIYLMAEETGNAETRKIYKERLKNYVIALYTIGMGEWDSPEYHGETLAAYTNLYDFTKDKEVKQIARDALDWLYTAAAFKYYRGGFAGPSARDQGGNVPLGMKVSPILSYYFGDTPLTSPQPDGSLIYFLTSSYRPPEATVALAQKRFDKPAEVLVTHPVEADWVPGSPMRPQYWETQFFGNSYQMGSVVTTRNGGPWSISPFKLVAYNSKRGVDYFLANTGRVVGPPVFRKRDEIAQYRNLLIWLRAARESPPFMFQLPKTAVMETEGGIWFFKLERTWLAVRPLNLKPYQVLNAADVFGPEMKTEIMQHLDERFLNADVDFSVSPRHAGFTLEVGEAETHGSYDAFKKAIKEKSKLDLTYFKDGTVILTGVDGKELRLLYNPLRDNPMVVRDGVLLEWRKQQDPYQPVKGTGPVKEEWMKGKLHVEAGDKTFDQERKFK